MRHSQWKKLLAAWIIAASSLVLLEQAAAETLRVSKDGSGGFSVIQTAVDAAAAGDTILIGAGHYTEFSDFQLDCCLTMRTYVGIPIENLTIIGENRNSVVIGPDATTGQETIIGMRLGASRGLVIEDVTVQEGSYGLRLMDSARIENVRFRDCWVGSFTFPDEGAIFEECLFEKCSNVGIFAGSGSRNVIVQRCDFVDNSGCINFTWSDNPKIDSCSFTGSGVTRVVAAGRGTKLVLTNCYIQGGSNYGVAVLDQAELVLLDTRITTSGAAAVWCQGADGFEARRNHLEGGWYAVLRITGQRDPVDITHNTIVNGSSYAIVLDDYPAFLGEWVVSLQQNYWSTSEIDSVRAWILDGNDDPSIHGRVKVAPILPTSPVSVEATTTGGFKALFRGRVGPVPAGGGSPD